MKLNKLIILLAVTSLANCKPADAQLAGVYHRSSGNPEGGNAFFVFDDHRFVVTFFGGVLVGTWSQQGDQIHFKPTVAEHQFYVYGRHNPDLKNGSRIYFQNFQDDPTFIGFNEKQGAKPLLKSVFNPSPNCVDYPSVAKFGEVPSQILLSNQSDNQGRQVSDRNVYTFENKDRYNDFVAYYQK